MGFKQKSKFAYPYVMEKITLQKPLPPIMEGKEELTKISPN